MKYLVDTDWVIDHFSTLQIQNCDKKQVVLLSHPEIPL